MTHRFVSVFLGMALLVAPAAAVDGRLQSFYTLKSVGSDASTSDNYILEVVPQGQDVRVRWIWVSTYPDDCGNSVVRAMERVVANTTVAALAGQDLCAIDRGRVQSALDHARVGRKPKMTYFEWWSTDVAVTCVGQERVLTFRKEHTIDEEKLKRRSPAIYALGDLEYRLSQAVFGPDAQFQTADGEKAREMEAVTRLVVPEIAAGRFNASRPWLQEYFATRGNRYLEVQPAVLLERDALQFDSYTP